MLRALKEVDRILRGDATRVELLRTGHVPIAGGKVAFAAIVLGLVYGFFMGWYSVINRPEPVYQQVLATTLKVPALFVLTLLVTFPSLYVFNTLIGSRLPLSGLFKLLIAALAITLAVLASFGPITAFFSITTENYSFMKLLNVMFFGVAGALGLGFLLRTLQRLSAAEAIAAARAVENANAAGAPEGAAAGDPSRDPQGPLDAIDENVLGPHVRLVFTTWVIIFGLVGAQMSWVLRPFIGDPSKPFEWFRQRESNFFEAFVNLFRTLLSG